MSVTFDEEVITGLKEPEAEEWRSVRGYKGLYEVSSYGNVRSLDRVTTSKSGVKRLFRGKLLKLSLLGEYLGVSLYKNGKQKNIHVHRLVALAFKKRGSNKKYVNHKFPVKTNNRADNLEWVTQKDNIKHSHSLGLSHKGEKTHTSKLKEEDVRNICSLLDENKLTIKEIASMFNVTPTNISYINIGESWNWLTNRKGVVKSRNMVGKGNPESIPVVNCRGEEFETKRSAALKYSIGTGTLNDAISGKRPYAGRYSDSKPIKWFEKED